MNALLNLNINWRVQIETFSSIFFCISTHELLLRYLYWDIYIDSWLKKNFNIISEYSEKRLVQLNTLYIQMEYCEKKTLRNYIDEGLHKVYRQWTPQGI